MIYDATRALPSACTIVDPADSTRRKHIPADTPYTDLLVPLFRDGQAAAESWTLTDARRRAQEQLALLHPGIRRFINPHEYPVGLEQGLHDLKTELILKARTSSGAATFTSRGDDP